MPDVSGALETLDALADAAVRLIPAAPGADRVVLGLAGPPGAGKSTLAGRLVRAIEQRVGLGTAAYVPLDGFHLSNVQLKRIGRLHRKGAVDTFDVWGYATTLARVVREVDRDVYVPDYDRTLHEPVAARHVVRPGTRIVVTEGNYLALDAPGWTDAYCLMTEVWYVHASDRVRDERLTRRQRRGGRSVGEAMAWVAGSDRPNGELVKRSKSRCARVVTVVW